MRRTSIGSRPASTIGLALLGILMALPAGASAACLPNPHACGYPDETNTGASGALTPSGSITVSTDGATVKDREVSGKITINADNVTIENVKIVPTATGSDSQAISNNGSGNLIRYVTAGGKGSGSDTIEAAVRGFDGVTLERDRFYNCNECVQGAATVRDSYMVVSSIYPGAHAEDIYICSEAVTVEHSTLINSVHQTATVFGDTICGGGNEFVVVDSLLAGGGFLLYPQANSEAITGTMNVSGNRFARCSTAPVYDESSGGTDCAGGPDAGGFYPYGGYYGVSAFAYSGVGQTWVDNVWDDSGLPVCSSGKSGCGSAAPPPPEEPPPSEEPPPVGEEPAPPEGEPGPPEGEPEPPAATPPTAIWTPPADARVGVPVLLDGSESSGDGPLSCVWSFEDSSGSIVWETHSGCLLPFTFAVADTKFVTLTVTAANGESDANRQSFPVAAAPPEVPDDPSPPETPEPESPTPPNPEPPAVPAPTAPAVRSPDASPAATAGPGTSAHRALRAVWTLPRGRRGQLVTLIGAAAGVEPVSCDWTVENRAGSRVFRRAHGCRLRIRMPKAGVRYLRLTVRDAYGRSDSLRRAIFRRAPGSGSIARGSATRPLEPARSAST